MVLWKSHKVSFLLLLTDLIRNQRILVNNLRLYPTSEIVALSEVRLEVIDGLMIDKFILIQIRRSKVVIIVLHVQVIRVEIILPGGKVKHIWSYYIRLLFCVLVFELIDHVELVIDISWGFWCFYINKVFFVFPSFRLKILV